MSGLQIVISVLVLTLFLTMALSLCCGDTMTIPWVSHNAGFGGGLVNVPKTKLRGHRFAKAADDGPDGRWCAGDLLIFDHHPDKPIHFSEGKFYGFVRYAKGRDGIPYPQMHVFKCIKWEHTKRPVFETNLENDFECIGELQGIRINGQNIMY